jgi:hypothetical protein
LKVVIEVMIQQARTNKKFNLIGWPAQSAVFA